MNALVTGLTGFTGGQLARHLVSHGYTVRGLVRPARRPDGTVWERAGVDVRAGDLTDPASLAAACRDVDVVFHLAAAFRTAGHGEATYRAVNVTGTEHLVAAAAAAGVRRVVHCSTGGVHGHIERPPADEDAPLAPGDVYQRTKLEGEQRARAVGAARGVEIVVARPIGIYGPGDTRFLKMFRGIARGRFPLLGAGRVFYHLTYIDDLVDGFRRCAETAAAAGRTYLLAGPDYTTLAELFDLIAAAVDTRPRRWRLPVWPVWAAGALCEAVCVPFGIEPPLYRRRVDFFTKSRAFTNGRARAEIGFAPAVDTRTGIGRTAAWYREQGWL